MNLQMHGLDTDLGPSWQPVLKEELKKPYFIDLMAFVENERSTRTIYPPKELVFNAFSNTPFQDVKVVIVGQDPYHGKGQAHGLSFSVPQGTLLPPSLKNIYKELYDDLKIIPPSHGCLASWAKQGVLLLNATLTVREGEPMSHHGKGWEIFTDAVIEKLYERDDPIIFVLWGRNAQQKCGHIANFATNTNHLILKAAHPSPFSAYQGFLGCKHFSKINDFLIKLGKTPINWRII